MRGEALERVAERVLADYVNKGLDPKVLIEIRENVFGIGGPKAG